jgi:hypothetical protein
MTSFRGLCALLLALLCVSGCGSKGSSQSSGESQSASSSSQADGPDGPSDDEIQRQIVAGIEQRITRYCSPKAAMLASAKSIRYTIAKRELLNTIDNGHKIIRMDGTLYWSFLSKVAGTNPSAGTPQNVIMTNDPSSTPDRQERWEFLSPPWRDFLGLLIDRGYCRGQSFA